MEIKISLDEGTEKGQKLLRLLDELGYKYTKTTIGAKEAAFGIGRKATGEELEEYLKCCLDSELRDINDLLKRVN